MESKQMDEGPEWPPLPRGGSEDSASNGNETASFKCWESVYEGVVHLKHFLSHEEQVALYEDVKRCSKDYKPTRARNPNSVFMKIMAYSCTKQKHLVPTTFTDFSFRACHTAHTVDSFIPPTYAPTYCTSFKYAVKEGRLTGHCDKVLGWVVLFSLGCTAEFWVKGPRMREKTVLKFESGDILVFNGGTEYDIKHGIDNVLENTAPSFLPELQNYRLSVQLRQSERNDNLWPNQRRGRGGRGRGGGGGAY